jgi:photosystem II stability/assembly factor-like uncharacterized protein
VHQTLATIINERGFVKKVIFIILVLMILSYINAQEWTNISPFPASYTGIKGNFVSANEGWIFQGSSTNRDIYYTEDGGENWEIIYSLEDPLEFIISLHMIDNQHGWMHKKWQNQYPYNSYHSYLKTTDGGYSWEDMTDNLPEESNIYPIYFINQNIGFLGAGSDPSNYQALIYKTIDGGENWYLTNTPIVYSSYPSLVNYSTNKLFFIDVSNGWAACSAYVGSGLSLYTTDGGENWDVGIEPGLSPDLFDIHFTDINSGGVVGHNGSFPYVVFTENNFETISYQHNYTWNQLSQAICYQNDSTVWISGSPGIINRSTNSGETFEIYQTIDTYVNSIQFFNNTGFIFGLRNGLFKFVDIVSSSNNDPPTLNYFLGNYPNPFRPSTTIVFSLYTRSNVELTIYNIKGQKMKTLINEFLECNYHSINWNGDDDFGKKVSAGIYFYSLSVNGKTEVIKKCVMLNQ